MKTILIIDDEYDIISLLKMLLTLEGYAVRVAYGGNEALESLRDNPLPDLILTDLMMPGMDGYALISAIRETPAYDKIPIIVASIGRFDPIRLNKEDWDHFILKPFDVKTLLFIVKKMCEAPRVKKSKKE